MNVLKSVDILIGLVVVLLALSMAVTVITQTITTIVNSRGRHLRRGLADLLQQIDPALTATISRAIATKVLTHPLVSGSNTPMSSEQTGESSAWSRITGWVRQLAGGPRLGNVVHREEFTKLLMNLASGTGTSGLQADATQALKTALARNGVADPDAALKSIRTVALRLERANPELSNMARQNLAILQEVESDLVGKIHSWFDQTMDRTSQRFTASTRAITFAGAFVVAFGLQADTVQIVNRLAADDSLRQAFVSEARALYADQQAEAEKRQQLNGQPQTGQPAGTTPPGPDEMARQYQSFLATNGIIRLPSEAGWLESLRQANMLGLLLTALLLSLGAPFWYSSLANLLQLRSALAIKDDAQRRGRQLPESVRADTPSPPAGPAAGGREQGDSG